MSDKNPRVRDTCQSLIWASETLDRLRAMGSLWVLLQIRICKNWMLCSGCPLFAYESLWFLEQLWYLFWIFFVSLLFCHICLFCRFRNEKLDFYPCFCWSNTEVMNMKVVHVGVLSISVKYQKFPWLVFYFFSILYQIRLILPPSEPNPHYRTHHSSNPEAVKTKSVPFRVL